MSKPSNKPTKSEVFIELTKVIERAASEDLTKFPDKYYVIRPELGVKQIVKNVGGNVVAYTTEQDVVDSLLIYIREWLSESRHYSLTHRDATECVKYWLATTRVIECPTYLGEKDNPTLCFHRLTFNYSDEPKETIILDELMSRCTNSIAVRQYIGSLTIENASRFQYLWVYGSGGEGKGSLGRGLISIFGDSAITMAVPRTDGQKQFLSFSLLGKRLCIFPECSNFKFPNDPLFKQYTGGDNVWFEKKGKMGFSGKLNCKFIFLSNDRPGVDGADANIRRMIYSEISKPTIKYSSEVYDALISAEMPSFIIKCRNEYLEKCPNNEEIQFNDETTKELIDENEEQFEVLTEKWFIPQSDGIVTPSRLREIQTLEKLDELKYRKWVEYMRLKLKISTQSKRTNNGVVRVWFGIRERDDREVAKWTLNKNSCNLVLLDRNTSCNTDK